jgi:hypothetical protein
MTCATIGIIGKIGRMQSMFIELDPFRISVGISRVVTINSF